MALSRFNRDYLLTVQVAAGRAVEIRPPIRIAFTVDKSTAGGLNKMTARIYNLQESNRLALVKDKEKQKNIPVALSVGYKDSVKLLFKGTVFKGSNFREGPDFVTEIECLDGGFDFLNSFTSQTVKGKNTAINAILGDMPNTGKGKITTVPEITRPKVLVGASAKLIDSLIDEGMTWYIDEEKLYILRDDEVISSYVPVVSAETGLLNTPTRDMSKVTFNTLLNPVLKLGGLCQLISTSAPHLNGVYRIVTMSYSGDNYGSEWSQAVTGFLAGSYRVV